MKIKSCLTRLPDTLGKLFPLLFFSWRKMERIFFTSLLFTVPCKKAVGFGGFRVIECQRAVHQWHPDFLTYRIQY